MDISIIIVNYKTPDLLQQTIDSVINSTKNLIYEIIVVDNASKDNSLNMINEIYKDFIVQGKLILIENEENLGFAKANNQGIKISQGRYVLLLNSDTVVQEGCIEACINFSDSMKEKGLGALGCKVILRDGRLDKACKRSFPTPVNSMYHALKLDKFFPANEKFGEYNLTYMDEAETNIVDCVMGAYMMVTREVIDAVGGLDEDFFMYGEDIEWCYRMHEAGFQIYYYPEVSIIHYKKASGKRSFKVIYEFYRAMILFYNKHYKEKYNPFVKVLVYLGVYVLMGLALLKNLFKNR